MNLSWIKEIYSEWKQLPLSKERYRNFGYLLSGVCIYLAILNRDLHLPYWSLAGLILIVIATLYPHIFKMTYRYWMLLAVSLGWLVSRLILILVFFIVITPIAIYLRLAKKDILDLETSTTAKSYWYHKEVIRQYTKMF